MLVNSKRNDALQHTNQASDSDWPTGEKEMNR